MENNNNKAEELARLLKDHLKPKRQSAETQQQPTCVIHNLYITIGDGAAQQLDQLLQRLRFTSPR